MKVIIPVKDNAGGRNILAQGFHNAEFACIYDSNDQRYEWVSTDDISTKPGNLSIELKRKGIFTVISQEMSLMALGLFADSGLRVYKAMGSDVTENIKLLESSELQPLTIQSVMGKGCHGSCSSCDTTCN